jgi:hypothetical protein
MPTRTSDFQGDIILLSSTDLRLLEETNGTITRMLKKISNHKEEWDVLLGEVLFVTTRHPRRPSEDSLQLRFCINFLHDFYITRRRQLKES